MLIISIILSICSCGRNEQEETTSGRSVTKYEVSDFNEAKEEQIETYLSLAETAAKNYYKSVIAGKDKLPSFPLSVSADCREYLKQKIKYDTKVDGENSRKYLGGIFDAEYEIVDDRLVCGIVAEVSFRYLDSESSSLFAEEIQIVIENPQSPKIIDWYVNDPASFDGQVRGDDVSLIESKNWLMNQNLEELLKKGKEITDKI